MIIVSLLTALAAGVIGAVAAYFLEGGWFAVLLFYAVGGMTGFVLPTIMGLLVLRQGNGYEDIGADMLALRELAERSDHRGSSIPEVLSRDERLRIQMRSGAGRSIFGG